MCIKYNSLLKQPGDFRLREAAAASQLSFEKFEFELLISFGAVGIWASFISFDTFRMLIFMYFFCLLAAAFYANCIPIVSVLLRSCFLFLLVSLDSIICCLNHFKVSTLVCSLVCAVYVPVVCPRVVVLSLELQLAPSNS